MADKGVVIYAPNTIYILEHPCTIFKMLLDFKGSNIKCPCRAYNYIFAYLGLVSEYITSTPYQDHP